MRYGETLKLGGATVTLHPAGHVLGSAQVKVECKGMRIVASGDYKDKSDPTCVPFELQQQIVIGAPNESGTRASFALLRKRIR